MTIREEIVKQAEKDYVAGRITWVEMNLVWHLFEKTEPPHKTVNEVPIELRTRNIQLHTQKRANRKGK